MNPKSSVEVDVTTSLQAHTTVEFSSGSLASSTYKRMLTPARPLWALSKGRPLGSSEVTLKSQRKKEWISLTKDIVVKISIYFLFTTFVVTILVGQAIPTASTTGALFVGAGFTRANPDYSPSKFQGLALSGTADLLQNLGVEAKFHYIKGPASDSISEKTYEIGLRARTHVGPVVPFLDILTGIGSFTYQKSPQNGSYGMFAGGGGIECSLNRRFLIRGEYEYQKWTHFPPRGLQPNLATVSLAYRLK